MRDVSVKISVIMPVYNTGHFLRHAIDSILSQSLKEIELVLVDDGSSDGSQLICDEYAAKDHRVQVIHQKNGGICNARNAALKMVKGDFVAFSDHDDEYLPGFLEDAYNKAVETGADVVKVSKKVLVTNNGFLVKERSNRLPDTIWNQNNIRDNYFNLFDKLKINCVWDSLFRRDFLLNNNLFFDEYYRFGGEDYDITARYLPYISKIAMMSKQYYVHYDRIGVSTSSKFKPFKFDHNKHLIQVVYDNAIRIGVDINTQLNRSNFFLTEFYINPAAALLSLSECKYSTSKKVSMLKGLKDIKCMQNGFERSKTMSIYHMEKKIGISYFLYKHNLYRLLLLLHKLRHIESNSRFFKFLFRD